MSSEEIAISVQDVHKSFKLPHERHGSIKNALFSGFRGKKTYEKQEVLKDISFEITKGEFFGIVGRNGSGKSTLLKLLAGIYSPDKGHIQINGKLTPFIELGVGFNPELTGRENVFLNGALLGFDRSQMEAMYDEIVEFAELEKFMDQKLKNYSSGMQVRLAFSIAIRADTEILVLDEVLAVGDANFQKKCFDYFHKLKEDKKTVILVSHDMESVRKFSDRALLLENSEIVLMGSPEKVSDEYIRRNIQKEKAKVINKKADEDSSNKIAIKSVKLLGEDDKEAVVIEGNQPVKVAVEYEVNDQAKAVNIGLGLYSESWGYVFGYTTQMDSVKINKKKGMITLSFDNLPLLHGSYYINAVCFGEDEVIPYAFQPRAATFTVNNPGKAKLYRGVVNLEHEWIL